MDEDGKYRAPALDKGLDILEFLAEAPGGLTQAEISRGLNRAPNEIYRMLSTLVRRSYVTRSPEGDRYVLSLKLMSLANAQPAGRRIRDIAEPLLFRASREIGQSCSLALCEEGDIVVSISFPAPGDLRLGFRPGAVLGLYNTGPGKVLAAFQSEERRNRMISRHRLVGGEEPLDAARFDEMLAAIREKGYSREASKTMRAMTCLTFPVLDPQGSAFAALTCPFIEGMGGEGAADIESVTGIFADIAREIGRQLGGADPVAAEGRKNYVVRRFHKRLPG